MRRKRLQHVADTLCHMFCGWRLLFSFAKLERAGSGLLEINVLEQSCRFNGEPIDPLSIVHELHAWMAGDLTAQGMSVLDLHEASLRAHLTLTRIAEEDRKTVSTFFIAGKDRVRQQDYIACDIKCESRVATDEKAYVSTYRDLEEWPLGWNPSGGGSTGTARPAV